MTVSANVCLKSKVLTRISKFKSKRKKLPSTGFKQSEKADSSSLAPQKKVRLEREENQAFLRVNETPE